MIKKAAAIITVLVIALGAIRAEASEVISEGFSDLALKSQHYYNTEVAQYPMTITKTDGRYVIANRAESGKTCYFTLGLKTWGTWNMEGFYFINGTVEENVIGNSTDWEYTFKILNPVTQQGEFVGGNHGSEKLVSIELIDGVTSESFTLENGFPRQLSKLIVKEKTQILINNNELLPMADIERKYTFVGNTLTLDTHIEFLRDMQLGLSYSAMACVNKKYGRYCNFDGIDYVEAQASGTTDGQWLGEVPAMFCDLHGDDPSVAVYVGIFNKEDMTDNFSNSAKTFLWDMTERYVKLYFSRFSRTSLETVPKGTTWDFSAYWKINVW